MWGWDYIMLMAKKIPNVWHTRANQWGYGKFIAKNIYENCWTNWLIKRLHNARQYCIFCEKILGSRSIKMRRRIRLYIYELTWICTTTLLIRLVHTEEKTKVVAAGWGTELIQLNATLELWQDDLKKWTNRRADWRNGCFGKMDDHHPPKMDVLPKKTYSNHPCILNG